MNQPKPGVESGKRCIVLVLLGGFSLAVACTPAASGTEGDIGGQPSSGSVPGGPRYHPPPGFEDCIHAEVKADCEDGWCRVPAGCFVIGSPTDEWTHGAQNELQTSVSLTHAFVMQQTEMTRSHWQEITDTAPPTSSGATCLADDCPVTLVTWWEAVLAANMLSDKEGLPACYQPYGCTGEMGKGRVCEGFENPMDILYDCLGYRLPTRAESEYSARAGTVSAFYSGDVAVQQSATACGRDTNLEKVAWYCHNSGGVAHSVGQLEPNGFGLYDQLGNVSEFLNDVEYWGASPGGDDPEGWVSRPDSRGEDEQRVLRTTRATQWSSIARAASRLSVPWSTTNELIGFRLVRSLPK